MGKLSNDICEKAFCKLKGSIQKILDFIFFEKDASDDENPDEHTEQYQLEPLLIINNTSNTSASAYAVVDVVFMVFDWRLE